jgi:hypothetical protein
LRYAGDIQFCHHVCQFCHHVCLVPLNLTTVYWVENKGNWHGLSFD